MECSLCKKELSRYGNVKLSDGFMCRDCASLKSIWLTPEVCENISVIKMIEHLNYRKDNFERLKDFKDDIRVAGKYTLYINKENRTFVISKRKDFRANNADILLADEVSDISINEERYKQSDYVNIVMNIKLDNSNIPLVSFVVNEFGAIEKDSDIYNETFNKAKEYYDALNQSVRKPTTFR